MSAPHIILDCLPSLCQKVSDLVEVWRSYNNNNFAYFFWDSHAHHFQEKLFMRPLGIPHTKLRTKFEVSNPNSFRDITL